jgi:hypothetical protein
MSITFEDELTKLIRRMAPGETLLWSQPLGRALEAVAYSAQLDRHNGRSEARYEKIFERVKAILSSNATKFELGLAVGIALALATEGSIQ